MVLKLLPRPVYQTDGRPELWMVEDGGMYLVYLPFVITSRIKSHGTCESGMYECVTQNSTYCFDWAPTLRKSSDKQLHVLKQSMHRRVSDADFTARCLPA